MLGAGKSAGNFEIEIRDKWSINKLDGAFQIEQ